MSFHNIMLQAHSGWRYIVLLMLAVAVVKFLLGWLQSSQWSPLDRRIGVITTVTLDIQLLLGLILWALAAGKGGLAGRLQHPLEHPLLMIVAIAMMHVGWSRTKKAAPERKFAVAAITFILTSIIVALGVARVTGVI